MNRRNLLGAILAAGIAPSYVRAGSLMVPRPPRDHSKGWMEIVAGGQLTVEGELSGWVMDSTGVMVANHALRLHNVAGAPFESLSFRIGDGWNGWTAYGSARLKPNSKGLGDFIAADDARRTIAIVEAAPKVRELRVDLKV